MILIGWICWRLNGVLLNLTFSCRPWKKWLEGIFWRNMEWKGTKMHTETIANKAVVATRHHLAQWYGLDDRGFETRQGLVIFLFTIASRPALGPTYPPTQWVTGALSMGVNQPGHEANESPPLVARSKNAWNYNSNPPIRIHGMVLS